MNIDETGALLAAIRTMDPRVDGSPQALVLWARLLEPYRADDAMRAFMEHTTESDDRVMPANIIGRCRTYREDRKRALPHDGIIAGDCEHLWDHAKILRARRLAMIDGGMTLDEAKAAHPPVGPTAAEVLDWQEARYAAELEAKGLRKALPHVPAAEPPSEEEAAELLAKRATMFDVLGDRPGGSE